MNFNNTVKESLTRLYSSDGDISMEAYFNIDGSKYLIEQFKIGFFQPCDHKGEPQTETRGGQIMISFNQSLPESFYIWSIEPQKFKSGFISFESKNKGTFFRVEFVNASCVNFNRIINGSTGLYTNIVLSPEIVTVNGVEHDNFWVR